MFFKFAAQLSNMLQLDEKERTILEKSIELFFRYGVRSVSMDEIASAAGMSKKTIYQYVDNKADLIERIMHNHLKLEEHNCVQFQNEGQNAIEQFANIFNFNVKNLGNMNPTLILELKKYYPRVWQYFEKHRDEFIFQMIIENIQQGQAEGLYRKDLNEVIIAKIYTNRLEMIVEGSLITSGETQYTFRDMMKELLKYHLHGIASLKGLEELKSLEPKLNL